MTESFDPDAIARQIALYPRNPWLRLRLVAALLAANRPEDAAGILAGLTHHPGLGPAILALWGRRIAAARRWPGRVNGSADFLGLDDPRILAPFRRRNASDPAPPRPFPPGLILPPLAGAGNDTAFLRQAAALGADRPALHVTILAMVRHADDGAAFRAQIAALRDPGSAALSGLQLLLIGPGCAPDAGSLQGDGRDWSWQSLTGSGVGDAALAGRMAQVLATSDLVLFLDGTIRLDPGFLARLLHLPRVSQMVVQPLVAAPAGADRLQNLLTAAPLRGAFGGPYPFRRFAGLNLAVPTPLLARAGLPDPYFTSGLLAGRELAYRLQVAGAWFEPIAVPALQAHGETSPPPAAEAARLHARAPAHWDRNGQPGPFEVPRLAVYIPAYKAARYIREAVDSVLDQDFSDLEICIAIDGSPDRTREVLERHYAQEPRLRWQENANGGIGYASNRAIRMSRSLYIGQLDSDDRLKPGAVRRLVERLDAEPDLACVYGSCERIDADGRYLQDEYRWPVFSREKMMVTSIVHHFRMFRRSAWERTGGFREDIANAVDYDIFLKLSETGRIAHIDEMLYQRRWHGANTSHVNEDTQTRNTHRVQNAALERLGLARDWALDVPNPAEPRLVSYRRQPGSGPVVFWPDYSWSNPYQKLLYQELRHRTEVIGGDIDAALALQSAQTEPAAAEPRVTFHLHWLNFLLRDAPDSGVAAERAAQFLQKLEQFIAAGGRLVWTIHNTLSHNAPHAEIEAALSARIADLADVLHVHCAASLPEISAAFPLPVKKVRISRHGHYIGAYPDHVTRDEARSLLGFAPDDDVILFTGQIRPYKGLEHLVTVFRRILAERPRARLVMAGAPGMDLAAQIVPVLTPAEAGRLHLADRFIEDGEWQLFFRAADCSVYPYLQILTSGSLLLSLSFGTPVVIPRVGMTAEVLEGTGAGILYTPETQAAGQGTALEKALRQMLEIKDSGRLPAMQARARSLAESMSWQDPEQIFGADRHRI